MKYIVNLKYQRFAFDDSVAACTFAEIAKRNHISDDDKEKYEVSIDIEEENKED